MFRRVCSHNTGLGLLLYSSLQVRWPIREASQARATQPKARRTRAPRTCARARSLARSLARSSERSHTQAGYITVRSGKREQRNCVGNVNDRAVSRLIHPRQRENQAKYVLSSNTRNLFLFRIRRVSSKCTQPRRAVDRRDTFNGYISCVASSTSPRTLMARWLLAHALLFLSRLSVRFPQFDGTSVLFIDASR